MDIPVLSLHQPWAALVAAGRKRIETRSWSHSYRGPLAIHATLTKADYSNPVYAHCSTNGLLHDDIKPLAFGAIVAVAELVDIVPMVERWQDAPTQDHGGGLGLQVGSYLLDYGDDEGDLPHQQGGLWVVGTGPWNTGSPTRVEDQRPYGDFAPDRFAWLLADIRKLEEPVPFKGGQGLMRRVDLDSLAVSA